MKRLFDLSLALIAILVLIIPLLIIAIAVKYTSPGPALYWSNRVGRNNILFRMPKFRSMSIETPVLATHLLTNPEVYLTPLGKKLRKTSLDEVPQLWSIIKGDMSFVGPRPALFNQEDLIALRTKYGVHTLLPGLTGWAQINGRDELHISDKVALDIKYMRKQTFWFDLKILSLTAFKIVKGSDISH